MALRDSSYPREPGPEANNFRILVIRLSAMGDVAMTVPILSTFTQQYPQIKITVLTKPFFKPMFAQFKNVEVFEAEVQGRHKGVFGLWKLYKELHAHHIDAVVDLHNVLRSKVLKGFFKMGGTPVFQIVKGRSEKKALTAPKNKIFKALTTTHQRYADVFDQLGFPLELSNANPLAKEKLSKKTLQLAGVGTKKWLGIAPFAAFKGKMYPLHLMAEVIKRLNDTEKYTIFLFGGGKKEQKKLESLATQFKNCVNITGKLSFSEELALISNLDAMLSMDSGNAHLAAMYGIPVVTLWGVTHPHAGFYPFDQPAEYAFLSDREKFPLIPTSVYGNKMPEGYEKAIETILPREVTAKLESVMNRQ